MYFGMCCSPSFLWKKRQVHVSASPVLSLCILTGNFTWTWKSVTKSRSVLKHCFCFLLDYAVISLYKFLSFSFSFWDLPFLLVFVMIRSSVFLFPFYELKLWNRTISISFNLNCQNMGLTFFKFDLSVDFFLLY